MNRLWCGLFLILCNLTQGQFENEIREIQQRYDTLWDTSRETIVFTGSSSIRLWNDLQERFPEHQIVNTGFGGSQTNHLLANLDVLVLHYNPKKVFIYEGDNDIFHKRKVNQVITDFESVAKRIDQHHPNTEIFLISVKPSIARWKLRGRYKRLNKKLQKLTNTMDNLYFVDVWYTMLNDKKLNKTLFIEDGLHMNYHGYDLWYQAIKPHVD